MQSTPANTISPIAHIIHWYYGAYCITRRGRHQIDGTLIDTVRNGGYPEIELCLTDLNKITDAHLLQVAAIEYPEAAHKETRIQLARVLIEHMPTMGALPQTISLLCRLGYNIISK